MSYFAIILIAFLISLFIGSTKVCWGLGIVTVILAIVIVADNMKWLD